MQRSPVSFSASYNGWRRLHSQSGQASVFLLVILGTFLLASVGFAVDLSNMWFRRQAAQSAADAACVAGVMDMFALNNGTITSSPGFTVGTPGDCASSSAAALCQYAGFNGYTATTSAAGWGSGTAGGAVAVNWTFPSSVTGVTAGAGTTYPFLNVVVQEKPFTWFMGLVGIKSLALGASCTCGVKSGSASAPILILHPTLNSAFDLSGGSHIVIVGGPQTSIQVNSSANGSPSSNAPDNAVYCSGGSGFPIDTSVAGPSGQGGNLAVVGGPSTNQFCGGSYILNNTTHAQWKSPVAVASDPYAAVAAPTLPSAKVAEAATPVATIAQGYTPPSDPTYGYIYGTWVASGTDSCPNTNPFQHYLTYSPSYPFNSGSIYGSCLEFNPGYYPNGIDTTSLAGFANDVAIFMPGVYYLNGNLKVGSSTTLRNAWVGTQPSSQGVMFYFLSGGPVFAGGSGAASPVITPVSSYYLDCSGTTTPSSLPASLTGNLLVSQCTAAGTYVGAPSSDTYSSTGTRGLLFFSAHSNTYNNTLIGAGASLTFAGVFYFHNNSYADLVQFNGAGRATFVVGSIVADQLMLGGSGTIDIDLSNSSASGGASAVGIFQ
ncbi:MAG: pilus assembly protein TadG-related protein [Acidobacteriaceae bacterium]